MSGHVIELFAQQRTTVRYDIAGGQVALDAWLSQLVATSDKLA